MTSSFEYTTATDHNLLCPICRSPFVDPWMSVSCEHFYCHTCILQHLNGDSQTCPCDRTPLDVDANQLVPAPRLVKLLCDELPVACTACETWTGQRADWQRHARVECGKLQSSAQQDACKNGCGFQAVTAEDLREHEQGGCDMPLKACRLCQECIASKDMALQTHIAQCSSTRAECPHCPQTELTRTSLALHLENDCSNVDIPCPHARFGCPTTGPRASILQNHLFEDCPYEPFKDHFQNNESRISTLEGENRELRNGLTELRGQYQDMERRVDRLVIRVGGEAQTSASSTSVEDSLAALSAQMAEYARAQTESQRSSERVSHDLRGELNSLQMVIHDLRGEMMALQQAQYYESASRFYSRSSQPPSNLDLANPAKDSKDGSSSSSSATPSSSTISPSSAHASLMPGQAMYPPPQGFNPALSAYPFPPPNYVHAGQPFYASPPLSQPHHMMQPPPSMMGPGRRFYGWPYPLYGGGTSPEGGPGGGTKL